MAVLAIQHSKRPTQARMKDEEHCIHMTGNGSSPVLGRRLDLEFCASGQTQQLRNNDWLLQSVRGQVSGKV